MSNVLTLIKNRRSIRRFIQRPVPQERSVKFSKGHDGPLRPITPNLGGSLFWRKRRSEIGSPRRWLRLWKRILRRRLSIGNDKGKNPKVHPANLGGSLSFLVCMSREGLRAYPDARRRRFEEEMALLGIGAAIQNMLLVAHSLGLGGLLAGRSAFLPSDRFARHRNSQGMDFGSAHSLRLSSGKAQRADPFPHRKDRPFFMISISSKPRKRQTGR
jgi:hypothetical protein